MHYRAASICLHPGTRLRCSHVFNDLSIGPYRRASSIAQQQTRALQDGGRSDLEAGTANQMKVVSKMAEHNKEIFVDDLAATLEAHRASNRAKIIRKIPQPPPNYQDWKRLAEVTNRPEGHNQVVQDAEDVGEISMSAVAAKSKKNRVLRLKGKERRLVKRINKKIKRISRDIKHLQNSILLVTTRNDMRETGQNNLKSKARVPGARRYWSQPRSSSNSKGSSQPWLAYIDSLHEDPLEQSALPPIIPMIVF